MFPYVHPSNKLLTISPRLLLYDHFTVGLLANMSSSYQSGLSSHHHTHVPKTASSIQFYGNTESHQYEPDESEGIWFHFVIYIYIYGSSMLTMVTSIHYDVSYCHFPWYITNHIHAYINIYSMATPSTSAPLRGSGKLVDVCKKAWSASLVADIHHWSFLWSCGNFRDSFNAVNHKSKVWSISYGKSVCVYEWNVLTMIIDTNDFITIPLLPSWWSRRKLS